MHASVIRELQEAGGAVGHPFDLQPLQVDARLGSLEESAQQRQQQRAQDHLYAQRQSSIGASAGVNLHGT